MHLGEIDDGYSMEDGFFDALVGADRRNTKKLNGPTDIRRSMFGEA